MPQPIDQLVSDMVKLLDENCYEDWLERASIMEHEAKLPIGHAEALALLDVLKRHPLALTGIVVIRGVLAGATQFLLANDSNAGRQHLVSIGAEEISACDLGEILRQQYGGIAMLATIDF